MRAQAGNAHSLPASGAPRHGRSSGRCSDRGPPAARHGNTTRSSSRPIGSRLQVRRSGPGSHADQGAQQHRPFPTICGYRPCSSSARCSCDQVAGSLAFCGSRFQRVRPLASGRPGRATQTSTQGGHVTLQYAVQAVQDVQQRSRRTAVRISARTRPREGQRALLARNRTAPPWSALAHRDYRSGVFSSARAQQVGLPSTTAPVISGSAPPSSDTASCTQRQGGHQVAARRVMPAPDTSLQ